MHKIRVRVNQCGISYAIPGMLENDSLSLFLFSRRTSNVLAVESRDRLGCGTPQGRLLATIGSPSSVWCVLEAELVEMLPGAVLRVGALDPLAPRDAAGEGRVCLVPFDDHLPQVARPHEPHIHLSERAKEEVQLPVCDAGQERRTKVSGSAEVWGGVVPARLEWRCSHS